MKKFLFFFSLMVTFAIAANAKIWRVNNMPGVTADFISAQAANNGAADGDTIHLEPSVNSYGSVNCNKRLVWLSTGTFLTENTGNQYSVSPGTVGTMQFQAGSEGSVASVVSAGYCYIYVSSISVVRSYFVGGGIQTSSGTSNILISQCYFANAGFSLSGTNLVITNNIVAYVDMSVGSQAVITNNVFTATSGSAAIYNSVFQNNISKGVAFTFNSSVISYNIHPATGFPAGNNNQLNVNLNTVFENNAGSVDKDFRLKAGSPAIGTGFNGADIGAFGGGSPFVLALQPAIPAITNLSSPSSTGNNTIQVIFSAKSNN